MSDVHDVRQALLTLLRELVRGAPSVSYVLNPGDEGLLAALGRLSVDDANAADGHAPVARHVDHLRYGLSLLNRWAAGEADPFSGADYAASWERPPVSMDEWRALRDELARELDAWHHVVEARTRWDEPSLAVALSSVVHLAYHMGAIRQIAPAAGGPKA